VHCTVLVFYQILQHHNYSTRIGYLGLNILFSLRHVLSACTARGATVFHLPQRLTFVVLWRTIVYMRADDHGNFNPLFRRSYEFYGRSLSNWGPTWAPDKAAQRTDPSHHAVRARRPPRAADPFGHGPAFQSAADGDHCPHHHVTRCSLH